ncbi:MAG TPA: metallophosphoesterase family protein [Bryobacteraceae bacterium]|nr:metallophosphoesterase family protein [Bryobacteraceae bacterium]
MRYLIVSDLHANWEALEAVLGWAKNRYEQIVCCGDLVGYGPDPNRVVEWCRKNLHAVIRGNHDRACCGLEDLEWFNPIAREASEWTMRALTEQNLHWLRTLPAGPLVVDGFLIAHGSPLDEDEYLTTLTDAANTFEYLESSLTFFGHTHLQGGFAWENGKRRKLFRPFDDQCETGVHVDPDGLYLVNPGSVGQPRDGDARAAFALFDSSTRDVELRRVPYDFDSVRRKIESAGLPVALGNRLEHGR